MGQYTAFAEVTDCHERLRTRALLRTRAWTCRRKRRLSIRRGSPQAAAVHRQASNQPDLVTDAQKDDKEVIPKVTRTQKSWLRSAR